MPYVKVCSGHPESLAGFTLSIRDIAKFILENNSIEEITSWYAKENPKENPNDFVPLIRELCESIDSRKVCFIMHHIRSENGQTKTRRRFNWNSK